MPRRLTLKLRSVASRQKTDSSSADGRDGAAAQCPVSTPGRSAACADGIPACAGPGTSVGGDGQGHRSRRLGSPERQGVGLEVACRCDIINFQPLGRCAAASSARAVNSEVEYHLDTVGAAGSIPAQPIVRGSQRLCQKTLPKFEKALSGKPSRLSGIPTIPCNLRKSRGGRAPLCSGCFGGLERWSGVTANFFGSRPGIPILE